MSEPTFTCGMCGKTFGFGWTEEEAQAEAAGHGLAIEACDLVCDDCYKLTPWGSEEEYSEDKEDKKFTLDETQVQSYIDGCSLRPWTLRKGEEVR